MVGLFLTILACGNVVGTPTYITTGYNSFLLPGTDLPPNHGSMADLKSQVDEIPVASTYSSILDKVTTLPQNVISQMITYIESKLNNLEKNILDEPIVIKHKAMRKRHAFHPQNRNKSYRKFPAPANSKQIGIGIGRPINPHLIKGKAMGTHGSFGKPINDTGGYYVPNKGRGHQKNTTHTNHGYAIGNFNKLLKNEHGIDLDGLSPRELHKLLGFLKSLQINNTTDINGKFKPNIGDICCPVG